MSRELRTELSLLLPEATPAQVEPPVDTPSEVQQTARQPKEEARFFSAGAAEFVKDFRKPSVPTWVPGRVLRRLGEVRYEVMADGLKRSWHANHLKSRDDTAATATSAPPDSSATTSRALLRFI